MFKRKIAGLKKTYTNLLAAIMLSMTTALAFAQEKGLDVDINVKKETEWYQQPWIWVVGAAVFILLLVAILRSGTRKE